MQDSNFDVSKSVNDLRSIAIDSLKRMYVPDERMFVFHLSKVNGQEIFDGLSHRYTAMSLIGLCQEDEKVVSDILGDHSMEDVCGRLIDDVDKADDMGQVAITAWASRAIGHPDTSKAMDALKRMIPQSKSYPTVELSWALTASVAGDKGSIDISFADSIAYVLMSSFNEKTGIFPHWSLDGNKSKLRGHISCFADFVYPIQALSYYHIATGNSKAIDIACRCAERMCELQGVDGQWWWHFDHRSGKVVEGYPVYSVHQDSMAPMALFDLARACGKDHSEAIKKGLCWLAKPTENTKSLIDHDRKVIWRKIFRQEPSKLVRGLQAAASSVHSNLRVPGVDLVFPPVATDWESRPYHMGWILYAWPLDRQV